MGLETGTGVHPAGVGTPTEGADTKLGGVPSLPALNVRQARASSPAGQDPNGGVPVRGGGKS